MPDKKVKIYIAIKPEAFPYLEEFLGCPLPQLSQDEIEKKIAEGISSGKLKIIADSLGKFGTITRIKDM